MSGSPSSLSSPQSDPKSGFSVQTTTSSGQSRFSIEHLLEEKNRLIDRLNKQVQNQRVQLEFYIKKAINTPEMFEFSKSCLPEATEENMMVALAVNKFYKKVGVKSRIMHLHEKALNAEERTMKVIDTLNTILSDVVGKLRSFMKPSDLEQFLSNFDINSNYIELFNLLTFTTVNLRKELNGFRSTCDRLSSTEEKRNAIVEQVYSLPPEERTICSYLVGIQMEKSELEHVVKQLSKNQNFGSESYEEIEAIENNLKNLHDNIDWSNETFSDKDGCVSKMLENMFEQAMTLLELSKRQKCRYSKEIENLHDENVRLRSILRDIEESKRDKETDGNHHVNVDVLSNLVQRTIEKARLFQIAKTEELHQKNMECDLLKAKLAALMDQKSTVGESSENEIDCNEIYRKENNNYKSQVANLQFIRNMYADQIIKQ